VILSRPRAVGFFLAEVRTVDRDIEDRDILDRDLGLAISRLPCGARWSGRVSKTG
jgi:hypothetical protein